MARSTKAGKSSKAASGTMDGEKVTFLKEHGVIDPTTTLSAADRARIEDLTWNEVGVFVDVVGRVGQTDVTVWLI